MVSFTTLFAGSAAIANIVAASPISDPKPPGVTVYKISKLSTSKSEGKPITSLKFKILSTNGGTIDFTCSPVDKKTGAPIKEFQDNKTYSCGKDSPFDLFFDSKSNGLGLSETIVSGKTTTLYKGETRVPVYCRGGGDTPVICDQVSDILIQLTVVPKAT
ncbi:hypothetical protein FKW77_010582 [Venturia effusa]|uniref:AA1-like domain-containing protein n=1 Tax=Venturia effusa TaxID=50376 RepID=A0A517L0M3_9PEZI|nr:hypothetical protein FKW77_010582 [Venturia effusa]